MKLRIVERQQRPAAELPDEAAEPHAAERQRQQHVEPAHGEAVAMEFGRDQPEEIDQPHDDDADCHLHEQLRIPLHGARQQDQERHGKMKHDECHPDQPPGRRQPARVPGDLLRQVAGIDDQVLRERKVGPEHHERQHQVAEIVKV